MNERFASTPVYSIAVAAQLAGLPQATLRRYEANGLLTPARTDGGTRRYSDEEITRLRQVAALQGDGVNLAGIGRVLDLQDENQTLRQEIADAAGTNTAGAQVTEPEDAPSR